MEKSWDDFHKRGEKRQAWCKSCTSKSFRVRYKQKYSKDVNAIAKKNELKRKRREHRRRFLWEFLSENPCMDCGEADPMVLEFDHVRGEKLAGISKLAGDDAKMEVIINEIDKCEIRCANCHRRKTYKQLGWRIYY